MKNSRKTIEKGIESSKKTYDDARRRFQRDLQTKKLISDTAASLETSGTVEGMREVQSLVREAGDIADQSFEEDNAAQAKETADNVKPREQSLLEMAGKNRQDLEKMRKALSSTRLDNAKSSLEGALKAGETDLNIVKQMADRQERERTEAEKQADTTGKQMQASKIRFNN